MNNFFTPQSWRYSLGVKHEPRRLRSQRLVPARRWSAWSQLQPWLAQNYSRFWNVDPLRHRSDTEKVAHFWKSGHFKGLAGHESELGVLGRRARGAQTEFGFFTLGSSSPALWRSWRQSAPCSQFLSGGFRPVCGGHSPWKSLKVLLASRRF